MGQINKKEFLSTIEEYIPKGLYTRLKLLFDKTEGDFLSKKEAIYELLSFLPIEEYKNVCDILKNKFNIEPVEYKPIPIYKNEFSHANAILNYRSDTNPYSIIGTFEIKEYSNIIKLVEEESKKEEKNEPKNEKELTPTKEKSIFSKSENNPSI